MKTKEITPNSLIEASKRCNLVLGINKKIRKIEKLKKEAEEFNKKDKIILFSEPVNFRIAKASGESGIARRDIIVDRMEIHFLRFNSSDGFFECFLYLSLRGGDHTYSFLFAKNKGSHGEYLVQTKEDKLIIMDGGHGSVEFSSAEDFKAVINHCDEYLMKFNDSLKGEKLIPHFNEPIVCFD